MSNFFPLIIDASGNVGTIQELPSTSNLDFTGSGIVNLATGNLQLTGGSSGQYLSTDGSGNLSWVTGSGSSYGDSNVVTLLNAFGSNTITTTGNVSVGNIVSTTVSAGNVVSTTVLVGNILIENNGSNVLSVVHGNVTSSNVATATTLVDLINFSSDTTVYNDLDSSVLTTTGSNYTLTNAQIKYGPYSWYCTIGAGGDNSINTGDITIGDLNTATDYTLDMWLYMDPTGSGSIVQALINGSHAGGSNDKILFGLGNESSGGFPGTLPLTGTLVLYPDGNSFLGSYNLGHFNGAGWYHVGLMMKNSVLYSLFNGVVAPVAGNPPISWPSDYIEFLGSTNGSIVNFASGYATNIRISKTTALFNTVGGTYTLPVSTDYDPTGNIQIFTTTLENAAAAPQGYVGWEISPTDLTALQAGSIVQMGGNVNLPLANSVQSGAKFNFTNETGTTNYVFATGSDFIYHAPILDTSNTNVALMPGETIEITSRGTSEWDLTGGTALLKYQPTTTISSLTSTVLLTLGGSVGMICAVTDNGGKLAYWDTSYSRWSYVFDNNPV